MPASVKKWIYRESGAGCGGAVCIFARRKMKLRKYQEKIITDTRAHLKLKKKVLVVAATASGKTATLSYMIGVAARRDFSSWFVVHKRELLRQVISAFELAGIDFGVIADGYEQQEKRVQIVMIQSLANRTYTIPDMIVIDEAHRSTAKSYDKIFALDCFIIGLSATPERTDGTGLGDRFDVIVESPSVSELIAMGFICQFKYYAPNAVGDIMKGCGRRGGDFKQEDIEKVFAKSTIVGDSVRDYREKCYGKRMLVFCYSIKHAKEVCAIFNFEGIPAAHLDGGMKDDVREDVLRKFKAGEILILTSCDLLLEGIDIPMVEVIDQQRPTDSLIVFMQSIGRGFRIFDGKDYFLVFDRVGNYLRHGLPDYEREWSLDSKPKSKRKTKEPTILVRTCQNPKCFACFPPVSRVCPECGYENPLTEREVRKLEGELAEVERQNIIWQKKKELWAAKSYEDFLAIEKKYSYDNGWARIRYRIRQQKTIKRR